jgi:hypothetical protein
VCNALALCTNPRVLPMGRQARRFRRCRSVGAPLRDVLPSPPTFGVRKRRRASTPHGQSGGAEPSGHFIAAEPGKGSLVASRQSGHLNHAQRPAIRVSLAGHPSCRATGSAGNSAACGSSSAKARPRPLPFYARTVCGSDRHVNWRRQERGGGVCRPANRSSGRCPTIGSITWD